MEKTFLILSLFLGASAMACPDFSGTYQQLKSSTFGDFKNSIGWPLQELDTVVTITQQDCSSIQLSYPNTRYSNAPTETVNLELTAAAQLEMNDHQLYAIFREPSTRVSAMGGTLKASTSNELAMTLDPEGISIHSTSRMKGIYNYVIPMISKDRFSFTLRKIHF